MAARIKKGDTVVVIAGRDKGRSGEVIEMRREGRVLVRGVNMVKRHQRQSASQEGGIISKEAPIHLSNVALADPKDGKPTRVGFKIVGEGDERRRCASPSARESRSMADKDDKAKKPEKVAAAADYRQAVKAAKDHARRRQGRRVPTRPRRRQVGQARGGARGGAARSGAVAGAFDEAIRGKLAEQFGYKNRFQVPASTRWSSIWASAKASPTAKRSTARPPTWP